MSSDTRSTPNILAERYASPTMRGIWSGEGKVQLERQFWIALMKAQREQGIDIPEEAIGAYEKVAGEVDLDSIMARERVTRHDVKARIEEFNSLAGFEHIHKGMTSRDLTENVEQLQVFRALQLVRDKSVAALARLGERAGEFAELVITGRTHNVAAQTTTFGKRIAMFAEEMLTGFHDLEHLITTYQVRGLKGAVGTQLDQASLMEGNWEKVAALEESVLRQLGFPEVATAVGQVYPRSWDSRVINTLLELASGPSDFAKTLRLMAGHQLAGEGFAKGQVGSSAMPHKMNSRSCERINGFHTLLRGYAAMAASLAGDQWNEGDVSCSVVRRVMLPDAFYTIDGLLETLLTVSSQMGAYPSVIEQENEQYLPFLLTTTILMEAVKRGVGRETAHEVIKEHAVATVEDMRSGKVAKNNLLERLAKDSRLKLEVGDLDSILKVGRKNTGAAVAQTIALRAKIHEIVAIYRDAADYSPESIL